LRPPGQARALESETAAEEESSIEVPRGADQTVVRVMTWNLWWRFGAWKRRQAGIVRVLEDARADIIGLQEVWATAAENQAQVLADTLGMHLAWCPSPAPELFQRRLGDRSVAVGNAILSRWPIERQYACVLPAGGADSGRTALLALLTTPAGTVPFATTQLTSAIGQSAVRTEQVRTLTALVAEQSPREVSPVVTGDFNAEPDSDELRLLGGHKTPPAVPGLVLLDSWRFADPADPGWTWDRKNPAVQATGEPDARIDYIFLGYRSSSPPAATVRSAWLAGNEPVEGTWPSDHAAVVAEVAWRHHRAAAAAA
jgi:endonuclease/exonuclease/phosphatase family metal-dependent hydrolase